MKHRSRLERAEQLGVAAVQLALTVQVREVVVKQAQQQRAALAIGMPLRELAVGEDGPFHPEICLVAMEPASNFLLVARMPPIARRQPGHRPWKRPWPGCR